MDLVTMFKFIAEAGAGASPTPPGPTPTTGEYMACVSRGVQTALVGNYYLVSGSSGNTNAQWYNADLGKYLYEFGGTWCISDDVTFYPGIADAVIDTRIFPNEWSGVSDSNYYYSFTYHAS